MHIHKLYNSWLRLPNGFVAETDAGICLFGEEGVLALDELPPAAYEYGRRKRPLFGKPKDSWRLPADGHRNAALACAYCSQADTLYFWQGGACACLLHAALDFPKRDRLRFYSEAEAQENGMSAEAIAANTLYRPLDLQPKADPAAFPLVSAFIVSPGGLDRSWAEDPRPGFAPIPGFASVEFVQDSSPLRSEFAAFAAMPRRFAELIGADFDATRWQAAVEDEDGIPFAPDAAATFPFLREGRRVAELTCVLACFEKDCFPYHDAQALILRYEPALQAAVDSLIGEICAAHRHILPLAPHLNLL